MGDERFVPVSDERSNAKMALRNFAKSRSCTNKSNTFFDTEKKSPKNLLMITKKL
jgi:6-phosphogluconolactonase/glucosamine-6-phosphate isomerase/deaminase